MNSRLPCLLLLAVVCGDSFATERILEIQNLNNVNRIKGEYLVIARPGAIKGQMFKVKADQRYSDQTVKKMRTVSPTVTVIKRYLFNSIIILAIRSENERNVKKLFDLPEVESLEANIMQKGFTCINQTVEVKLGDYGLYGSWGLARTSSRSTFTPPEGTYTYMEGDGNDTYAYVIDTGVRVDHMEFNGKAVHGFTAPAIQLVEGDSDRNGHGTHCAGTIIGSTYGIAKSASVIAVKVLNSDGEGTVMDFLDGVQWVFNDFRSKKDGDKYKAIASMSLGTEKSPTVDAVVQEIIDEGLGAVVAAANDNIDACQVSPGHLEDVINVGASDITDYLASYSNWGECVDIIAPGSLILSAYYTSNVASAVISGTSMAAPHVSGVLLRYMSQLGHRPSPKELTDWLMSSSTKNAIYLRGQTTTPNRLLYASCEVLADDGNNVHAGLITVFTTFTLIVQFVQL